MPHIILEEQRGFIKGRNIKDCICLTSEAVNLLSKKTYGGNIACKIDISKAFDTLNWGFLIKVLSKFSFNSKLCSWIKAILESTKLSVSVNGKQHGFFHCNRGVKQGDPLSPLLFCLAEDVLSRSISKLVQEGKVELIKASRHQTLPSHILYADDVMIFCKGKSSCIQALQSLFIKYAECSGQVINPSKSTIYAGFISNSILASLAHLLSFSIGTLPFLYLGVPIFKGKPKVSYFQPLFDKIKLKLSSWKASLLSIAGRVQLVKSVIQSMLVHCISVYSWPVSLIKGIERCIRNFIWAGDIEKRKLVTVAWHKTCKTLEEGGLGIRSISVLNEASNLNLCWILINSTEAWALVLKSRVLRKRKPIRYHIFSSIWSSTKSKYSTVAENSFWNMVNKSIFGMTIGVETLFLVFSILIKTPVDIWRLKGVILFRKLNGVSPILFIIFSPT